MATQAGSLLATRRGRLTLLLLCAVQFLDIADPLHANHGMRPAAELPDEAAPTPANTPQQQT